LIGKEIRKKKKWKEHLKNTKLCGKTLQQIQ
jgi:hypothetical protein